MQASQRIMHNLRPPVLEAGVVAALEWQARQFATRTGLACEFSSNIERATLSDEAAITVYRCAQEALTNIVKHAGARTVRMGPGAERRAAVAGDHR
jgi:signal transduction histidine kinase